MTRALPKVGSLLLSLGAALGGLCLLLVVLGPLVGVRPLLFRSGSMAPTIDTGDVALVRSEPASSLVVGDIVSVRTAGGDRVTHRIVDVSHSGESASLTLRGDANESPDPQPYVVTRADRVLFTVPWVGHLIAWASRPLGLFLLGMVGAGMLLLVIRGGGAGGSGTPGHRNGDAGGRGGRRAARRGAAVGAAMTMAFAGPSGAAAWTDDVGVTGTSLTAYTAPQPTLTCTDDGILGLVLATKVTMTWSAPTSPAIDYSAKVLESGQILTVNVSGSTRTAVIAKTALITLGLGKTATVAVTGSLHGSSPLWVGQAGTQTFQTGLLGLTFGC